MLQTGKDLNEWFSKTDPWEYESNLDDKKRKDILFSTLPDREYKKVLDIGCGHGFVTRDMPGKKIIGVDYSDKAIVQANKTLPKSKKKKISYQVGDLFTLDEDFPPHSFDLIVITGVLYPQYIGKAGTLVFLIVDKLLKPGGVLATVHINEWGAIRFPYLLLNQQMYNYRTFTHNLEVYQK
jgi:2-polyprenyl-3-methyl-5-hydroxy-6-metoxy-1,4-benzoquinol methylase